MTIIDRILVDSGTVYSVAEIDELLAGKADQPHSHEEYLTIIDAAISYLAKADAIDAYSKTEADARYMQIATALVNLATKKPKSSGFYDTTESALSFVDGTRMFTVAPVGDSFTIFTDQERVKSSAESVTISNDTGLHFIYYESDTLLSTTTFTESLITDMALVAAIYWNATTSESIIIADERHGVGMDPQTHLYLHKTAGTAYGSGLQPGNIDSGGNGDDASHATLTITDGVILDEDIKIVITDGSPQDLTGPAQIPTFYQDANGWRKTAAGDFPVSNTLGGLAEYNLDTGGVWSLAAAANNDFVLSHILATGDISNPIICIIGQATYLTRSAAEDGALVELQSLAYGRLADLSPEFLPVCSLIYQTSTGYSNGCKARIQPTDAGSDFVDYRQVRGAPVVA